MTPDTPHSPAATPRRARPAHLLIRLVAAGLTSLVVIGAVAGVSSAAAEPSAAVGSTTEESTAWSWPVALPLIVRGFEAPPHRYGAGHRGIDLQADAGTEVVSPDDGVVRFAGPVAGRSVISLDHGNGLVSTLEAVVPEVAEGERVERGQRIATVAASEHCGSCLHLGARLHGEYLSPLALLGGVPRAVLLPVK